eukprot:TRINITY_DN68128_c8_g1_i1.p1 TRINITY_DN68128_c8_g1~~TRINITY_DN68128_c8_g1_i1.p1  ORF type:complete len:140 (-),score=8.59 TRINITY_DN68128_c8_g1_i1:241-660(-)
MAAQKWTKDAEGNWARGSYELNVGRGTLSVLQHGIWHYKFEHHESEHLDGYFGYQATETIEAYGDWVRDKDEIVFDTDSSRRKFWENSGSRDDKDIDGPWEDTPKQHRVALADFKNGKFKFTGTHTSVKQAVPKFVLDL